MSAYLKFFELEQSPFEGKAQAQVVLGTRALREAFSAIESGLENGASRICVSGERGFGKTSLARALPKMLGDSARVALVRDPTLGWESLRGSLAQQWGLEGGGLSRSRLIEAADARRLVLVIDQAECAPEDFLDHLDVLLCYRSESDEPVVQSVLLARLSNEPGDSPAPILWWLDRIQTLQLEFAPLPRDGVESYIHKHLKRAGWRGDQLFTPEASRAIHGYTGGIPGEVSKLCEKLLADAADQKRVAIDADFVHSQCDAPAEDEEPWTLEDEFEALVLEEEFDACVESGEAGPDETPSAEAVSREALPDAAPPERSVSDDAAADAPETATSFADALEHFGGLAEGWDSGEETSTADDASSPPPVLTSMREDPEPDPESTDSPFGENSRGAGSPRPAEIDSGLDSDLDSPPPVDAASVDPWSDPFQNLLDDPTYDDDPLNAPPTEEELRAIRGGWMLRSARPFLAAAFAAILGGLIVASFTGGPEEHDPSRATPDASSAAGEMVLFQPAGGFVSPESAQENRRASPAADPEATAIAPSPSQQRPDRFGGSREGDPRGPSGAQAPASPDEFGWDDLR